MGMGSSSAAAVATTPRRADLFSVMLSACPYVIFKSTGSWSTARKVFPAKSVLCNFGGAFVWAIYMNFQMYLSYGYSGLDALIVNCVSMVFNVAVLLAYFKDGKEYLKFHMCLAGSVGLTLVYITILVFHPYSASLSNKTIRALRWWSTCTAITGIVIFAILNLFPFKDLWNMSRDGDRDVTLDWPMQLCTIFNCFVSFLWTIYAWVFPSSAPNYFLVANLIVAALSLVQCFWLGVICLNHRKVEGQVTDAESLRTSFLKLAEALEYMASVPRTDPFWKRIGFFREFLDHMSVVTQSLSEIRLALERQLPILQEKEDSAAARQAEVQATATTLADNAKSMVEGAARAAREGTAAAATTQLANQQADALRAHARATAAIASAAQVVAGQPAAGQVAAEQVADPAGRAEQPAAGQVADPAGRAEQPAAVPAQQPAAVRAPRAVCVIATNKLVLSKQILDGVDTALSASSSHAVAVAEAAGAKADARAARSSSNDLIEACAMCISAFEIASTAISNRLTDAQGDAQALSGAQPGSLQVVRILAVQTAIKDCSPRLRFIASRVRSSLQVINATVGIPAPLREGLRKAHEHMLVLQIAANSPFFSERMARRLRGWFCKV